MIVLCPSYIPYSVGYTPQLCFEALTITRMTISSFKLLYTEKSPFGKLDFLIVIIVGIRLQLLKGVAVDSTSKKFIRLWGPGCIIIIIILTAHSGAVRGDYYYSHYWMIDSELRAQSSRLRTQPSANKNKYY
jgi:hypothetical protein